MSKFNHLGSMPSEEKLALSRQLTEAESCDEIINIFVTALSPFGFSQFVYGLPLDERPKITDYVILTNLNSDWMQLYQEERLYQSDVALDYCLSETAPLRWVKINDIIRDHPNANAYARTWSLANKWGLNAGVTVPLPFNGRFKGGISLVAPQGTDPQELDRRYLANEADILALVHLYHSYVNKSVIARAHFGLSNREIDVLQLVSEGLQTKQIAAEFDTSPHTVEKQMKSAREKLGTRTTAEAVTNAALLGLVR